MQLLRFFLFSFFFCLSFASTAQETIASLDSLERALKNKISDQDRFAMLERLFNHYKLTDYQKALGYANQSYATALVMGDSNKIVLGGRQQAYVLMDLGKNKEAVEVLTKSLAIAERNKVKSPDLKKQIKFILNNIGLAYDNLGSYDLALKYQFKSLQIREEEGDKKSIGNTLNNIGLLFYNLKDHENGIRYFLRALHFKKEAKDSIGLAGVYINLGLCYNETHEFNTAISYFNQSFDACGKNCPQETRSISLLGLGVAYRNLLVLDKAEDCFTASFAIANNQGNLFRQSGSLYQLSLVETAKGRIDKALPYIEKALKILERIDYPELLISAYEQLFELHSKDNNYKKAALYMGKYIKLNDSIHNNLLAKNLTKVQTEYAERENQKTIASQKEILALNARLITRQKQQTIFIAVIALLLLLLAGVLYKNYRDKLIANRRLDEKVKERTEELRASHHRLDKSFSLQKLTMQQVLQEGQSILGSIKGLCHVAQLDLQEVKEYMTKIDDNTGRLATLLARLDG
jgi:tetratricopeptide (TPR) repeat protein